MNHHYSTKGYISLIYILYAGITLGLIIAAGLLKRIGVDIPFAILTALKVGILFTAIFMCAGRFIAIEKRAPTGTERNKISFWAFLWLVLGMVFTLAMGLGPAQANPDIDINDVLASRVMMLAILSICAFLFLHLNFGAIARMRLAQTK